MCISPFSVSNKLAIGVKTCEETLLRKASDHTAHVAEVGLEVGGLRPSDTSYGVYQQSEGADANHVHQPLVFIQFCRSVWLRGSCRPPCR